MVGKTPRGEDIREKRKGTRSSRFGKYSCWDIGDLNFSRGK